MPHNSSVESKELAFALCLACVILAFPQLFSRSAPSASSLSPTRPPTGLPDLIVDQASLRQHWVVRVEDLPASFAAYRRVVLRRARTRCCASPSRHQTSATLTSRSVTRTTTFE